MIGACYYPWYGKPAHPILGGGEWRSGYTNHPVLGEYNIRDPAVINQHIAWAKSAGIDFFAMNWTGPHTWEDITLRDYYLSASKASEIKFCIFYDSYLALNKLMTRTSFDFDNRYLTDKTKGQKFLEDFEYLADTYFDGPNYLKINNRPLVIIYIVREFRNAVSYFKQLKANLKKKGVTPFLIADVTFWSGVSTKDLSTFWKSPLTTLKVSYKRICNSSMSSSMWRFLGKYFDGITGYNMYEPNRVDGFLKDVDREYERFYNLAQSHGLCFIPSPMPGYDDRKLRGLKRPILERSEVFYKDFWEVSKKYLDPSTKLILITTFNEWHEGTEIEPSKEYGTTYLELTKYFKKNLKC